MGTAARSAAVAALLSVERGEHADRALHDVLSQSLLERRDRALAFELVMGTLRRKLTIDWRIGLTLKGKLSDIAVPIQWILRLGAYQVMYLDRVPAHAAVNEAVNLARRYGHKGTAGLVNAVLRKIADEPAIKRYPCDPLHKMAAELSHPAWMLERWLQLMGQDQVQRLCEWNNALPPLVVRPNRLRVSRAELMAELSRQGVSATKGSLFDDDYGGVIISGAGDVSELTSFSRGLFQVQDEAAMLVSVIAGVKPGMKVLDACAGLGGKTTHIAELMNNDGHIAAVDRSEQRLADLEDSALRLGIDIVELHCGDIREIAPRWNEQFDVVVIDAPCSNTGVLGRNPDARWRQTPADIMRLQQLQQEIVTAVMMSVKPGGVIIYATCSLEPEENGDVVHKTLGIDAEFGASDFSPLVPERARKDARGGQLQLLPHIHGCDGMFMAKARRMRDQTGIREQVAKLHSGSVSGRRGAPG